MANAALLWLALRASLVLLFTLLVLLLLGRTSASVRRLVALLGACICLTLPLIILAFPERPVLELVPPPAAARIYAEALPADDTLPAAPLVMVAPRSRVPLASLLGAVWLLGTVLLSTRVVLGLARARALVRRARGECPGICVSPQVDVPVVVGLLAPVVLLPVRANEWSADRRHVVLLHEFSHVRRRDGLALLVAQIVCALYWFQPLAWLTLRRLRRECELAADEDVIRAGIRPSFYAEHLLAIARSIRVPASGIAMAARPSALARRISVLVSREQLPRQITRRMTAWVCLGAVVLLALVACTEAAARNGPERAAKASNDATVDPSVQAIVTDEAQRTRIHSTASRVSVVVVDPKSGKVLAASDDAPGRAVVPASTLKPLVVALALDSGSITPEQRFDCGNGGRAYGSELLRDAGSYGLLDVREILAVSSNVGMSRIFDVLGGERLSSGLARFGLAAPPPPRDGSLQGAVLAIGQRQIATSPQALAMAYAAIANDGLLVSPGRAPVRVIAASTARTVRSMLEFAVARGTGKAARIAGVRVGGKTGTSDSVNEVHASFVGLVPVAEPRFVIYVGLTSSNRVSGGTAAAPLFARIAARVLAR